MTKGVLLLAFGKTAYAQMAVHMAASLKYHNSAVQVALLGDAKALALAERHRAYFDVLNAIPEALVQNPGIAKMAIPKLLPFDVTLFLDCDGIALKDVSPLLDLPGDFYFITVGKGKKDDDINYMYWATNENAWTWFGLTESDTYYAPQTSAMFFRRDTETVGQLYRHILKYADYPMNMLKNHWGRAIPDELIYGGAAAKLGFDPNFSEPVVFFGHNYGTSIHDVKANYYILSAYGNGQLVKSMYLDLYDRIAERIMRTFGKSRLADIRSMSRQKHVS